MYGANELDIKNSKFLTSKLMTLVYVKIIGMFVYTSQRSGGWGWGELRVG